jgi:hypothetical protein
MDLTLITVRRNERGAVGIPCSRFCIRWADSKHFGHPPCSGFFPPLPERESLLDVAVDPATHSLGLYPLSGGEPDLGSSAAVHTADRAADDRVGSAREPITTVGSASNCRTFASHEGTIAWGRIIQMAFHGVSGLDLHGSHGLRPASFRLPEAAVHPHALDPELVALLHRRVGVGGARPDHDGVDSTRGSTSGRGSRCLPRPHPRWD